MNKRVGGAAVAALLVLGGTAHVASAATTPDVLGQWVGFSHSGGDPDLRGEFSLDVDSQEGSHFSGEIRSGQTRGPIAVVGTVSGRGHVIMRSATPEAPGEWIGDIERPDETFRGRYRTGAGTASDQGIVAAVHLMPDTSAPLFIGDWSGSALRTAPSGDRASPHKDDDPVDVSGDFPAQDEFGRLAGTVTWATKDGLDRQAFDVVGQAFGGDGSSEDGLVLVGSSDRALIVVRLSYPRPPRGPQLEGRYVLLNEGTTPPRETGSITLAPLGG